MKKFTKPILALTVGAVALTSCNKTSVPDVLSFLPGEIFFAEEGITVDTKAFAEATTESLQTNGFNVAAVIDADNSVIFNKAVAYSGSAYSVPGEHYYYPKEGTMSFYAVYPKTQAINVASGVATLSYAQNADTDLVAAKKTDVAGSSDAVSLAFEHLLSQVSIKMQGKKTTVDYKLKSVKITAADGGTYAFADGAWTPSETTADVSFYNNAEGMAVSTSAMSAIGSPASIMPGNVKLNVVWECYNHDSENLLCSKDVTVDVSLPQGKHTTLNLTLPFDSSELTFDISVGAWVPNSEDVEMALQAEEKPEMVSGVFTVNDSGKTVKFTKGNLYWDGSKFSCEANQYDYPTSWDASHVGHFFWSKDARVAYAADYNAANTEFGITPATTDTFFAADGGVFEGFTVLSKTEWGYLFSNAVAKNSSSENTITIAGKSCLVLKPDGFSGTVADSYTAAEWVEAEKSGLVALPFAGSRTGSSPSSGGSNGDCWSSAPSGSYEAWYACFGSNNAATYDNLRYCGYSVRLVSVQ